MGKTAIILGATGLTGGHLLQKLIDDDRYKTVIIKSSSSDLLVKGVIENLRFTKNNLKVLAEKITRRVANAKPLVPISNS